MVHSYGAGGLHKHGQLVVLVLHLVLQHHLDSSGRSILCCQDQL